MRLVYPRRKEKRVRKDENRQKVLKMGLGDSQC